MSNQDQQLKKAIEAALKLRDAMKKTAAEIKAEKEKATEPKSPPK